MAVIDSYSETNDVSGQESFIRAGQEGAGQSFTTLNDGVSYTITSCRFYMNKQGSPTGNAVAKLYAHSGTYGTSSIPTGAALATSDNFDVSTLSTTKALATFTFSVGYAMAANTQYCITCEYSGGDGSNYIKQGNDNSSPSHGGNIFYTVDAGSSWNALNGFDCCFYVDGTAAASGPAGAKTVNGLAVASVKTYNGLSWGSVKTINGLA